MGTRTNAFIAIISIFLGLLLGEYLLRVSGAFNPTIQFTDDSLLGMRGVPGGEMDKNGFRNEKTLREASIVAIGDSQTLGLNAKSNESWPAILGRLQGESYYQWPYQGIIRCNIRIF